MDLKRVLETLLKAFDDRRLRYALIGGFAMGLWGMGRATVDLDFLVQKEDLAEVDEIMSDLGYECKVKTDNVAQYLSPLKVFGEVDFLLAFREPSLKMLHRAEEKVVFRDLRVRVLRPEDLIGLKLQAIKNNPDRRAHEMEDILFLAIHYREELDWSLVQEYVKILEVWEIFNEIQRRLKGS